MLARQLGFVFLMATVTPAAAQPTAELDGAGIFILVLAGCVLLAIVAAVIAVVSWIVNAIEDAFYVPPSPPPRPEDYDQHAALVRAKARAADAQAAYDDSLARAALKKAELKEVEDFIKQQHAVRSGGNRR